MTATNRTLARHGAAIASVAFHGAALAVLIFKLTPPTLTSAANAETPAIAIEIVSLPTPSPEPVTTTAAPPPPPEPEPVVAEEPPPVIESTVAETVIDPPPPKIERKPEPKPKPAPVKQRPTPEPIQAPPTETIVASDPTPPLPTPAPVAPQTALAAPTGRSGPPPDYLAQLHSALERNKDYPRAARQKRQQGRAMLRFAIDRGGNVLAYRIEKSTGYEALDREVVAMIQRASPLPPMPADMTTDRLEVVVPIPFVLR